MDIDQLRIFMKEILSDGRFQHSLGVEEVCYDLALVNEDDILKARIAGVLHDCAKHLTDEQYICECERFNLAISETERRLPRLLHAKLGAIYAREKYGVKDDGILNSIVYHTTGRPDMSQLEKIVFIADYIEPNRSEDIPNINIIRKIAYQNLDAALLMILENTLKYLNDNNYLIDPTTKETYCYYVNQMRNKSS